MLNYLLGKNYYLVKIQVKEEDSVLTFSNHGVWVINDIGQKEADL